MKTDRLPVLLSLWLVAVWCSLIPAGCDHAPKTASDADQPARPSSGPDATSPAVSGAFTARPGVVLAGSGPWSGMTFTITSDGVTLIVQSAPRGEVFRGDVVARCGRPAVGASTIRSLAVQGSFLEITLGKHSSAHLDLRSMTLACKGSD